jgi:hypothetical protein
MCVIIFLISKSASCTHVSALLHALLSLTAHRIGSVHNQEDNDSDNEALPITSYLCQWKQPRSRKESNMPVSSTEFRKHVYGRVRKHHLKSLEDFDPRPLELRGTAQERLKEFLSKIPGEDLGVSLLFDESYRCWSIETEQSNTPVSLPSKEELQRRVDEFKKSLCLPSEKLREIEQSTRTQSQSSLWHTVRRYRLTASYFGTIYKRKASTSPHSLVMQIIQRKPFTSEATEWGIQNESVALRRYVELQHHTGHNGLYCSKSGFVISEEYPFLGASPDAVVHDPTNVLEPFGVVEIKCPFSFRKFTPVDAAKSVDFFCEVNSIGGTPKLKQSHQYFCQVQGQMAITGRNWCDFVVYTEEGIFVESINFDPEFWEDLLKKLILFYDNCLAPELVCPVHVLGINVRNLCEM